MRKIYEISKTELQTLFYSPIAWLIIIIFVFQISLAFTSALDMRVTQMMLGYRTPMLTQDLFANPAGGLLFNVQNYLYLYIPLLTMGLMSRELSSGSIKLLYSSPVTNTQIILGKYFSMLVYALILIAIVGIYVIFGCCVIENVEWRWLLTGMLGLYLLICTYAAIGLFMSSLTAYQVVAAIGTLAILAVLNYVKMMWQDIEFVRDITYWFSMSGRSTSFLYGFIGSEDVLYFLIVILLFLSLTIVRLQACRQKATWTTSISKYVVIFVITVALGYITSRPVMKSYYDATTTKANTLTPNSQKVIEQMDGGLTITTYVNLFDEVGQSIAFPRFVNMDMSRFSHYLRFKPEIKLKYVYYYDSIYNPSLEQRFPNMTTQERAERLMELYKVNRKLFLKPGEVDKLVDLSGEGKRFVRELVRDNGERTFLRIFNDFEKLPSEAEITAAFKRITMKLPVVGFLGGHGERSIKEDNNRSYSAFVNYKSFRPALINQGFDVEEVTLEKPLPAHIRILVIADPLQKFTEEEQRNLEQYIERGDNLVIATEPKRRDITSSLLERFGVKFVPGILANSGEYSNLTQSRPMIGVKDISELYLLDGLRRWGAVVSMPDAVGLEYSTDKGFHVTELLATDSLSWNELQTTDFMNEEQKATFDSNRGEEQRRHVTGLVLTRNVGEKEQKITILGDADCLSNGELSSARRGVRASNFTLVQSLFFWLSDGEVPIDVRRPVFPDNNLLIGGDDMGWISVVFQWLLPCFVLIFAIVIWLRRRGR
ncbi:Gldg family protein [Butyricimonas synergistica]|uniref:Gldg family protein n=1 Tax=Butyricimonas synergistica TaxID=544644 RepID=UPI0003656717|nr:Gldg family protein [Butyricimonas synergistica]